MNFIRIFLSTLVFILSLTSCAPSISGPTGQPLRVVRGAEFAAASTLPLSALNDQVPASAYVTFPDCTGAAVMVADVRQYGSEATNRGCKLASSSSSVITGDVILIGAGGAAVGILLFLVIARAYIASIP